MTLSKAVQAERAQDRADAIEALRADLPPGTTVWTVLRWLNSIGDNRSISALIVIEERARIHDASWRVARAIGSKVHQRHGGVVVGGCGMDMGYHLVYALSRALYPDGFECIGTDHEDRWRRCPSNDHANREVRSWHPDGGYALRHEWL